MLVNETFARRRWGRTDVVGQRLRISPGAWQTVTGVVNDVRPFGPSSEHDGPQLYQPTLLTDFRASVVVRTEQNPDAFVAVLRDTLRQADSRAVVTTAATVESLLWQAIAEHRFSLILIALFAVGAVLLAAVGLYSVIAQSLEQRRNELAVRSALGANARRLVSVALRSGVAIAVIGLVLGGILTFTVLRLAPNVLYTSTPSAPWAFVVATITVAFAVAAALLRPLLLAATIDPNRVLREE